METQREGEREIVCVCGGGGWWGGRRRVMGEETRGGGSVREGRGEDTGREGERESVCCVGGGGIEVGEREREVYVCELVTYREVYGGTVVDGPTDTAATGHAISSALEVSVPSE